MRTSRPTLRAVIALIAAYGLALHAIAAGLGSTLALGHVASGPGVECAEGASPAAPLGSADHIHSQLCCTPAGGHGLGDGAAGAADTWFAVRYASPVAKMRPLDVATAQAPAHPPVGSRAPPRFV
jgi:hypothetical protein